MSTSPLRRLDAALASETITLIELESPGGLRPPRALARRILDRARDPRHRHLPSACTLIASAGPRRNLAPGARLSFTAITVGLDGGTCSR
ncbi:MAG: hypothetical protein R3D85_08100 [Paracoccaceae bacterium]